MSSYLDWIQNPVEPLPLTTPSLSKNASLSKNTSPSGLSDGAIAGIVVGSVAGVAILGVIGGSIVFCVKKFSKNKTDEKKKVPPS